MWNSKRTDVYEGMLAETVTVKGYGDDFVHAYYARPLGEGPFPAVVLIPHMPGWDEFYRETTRRFAHHGYLAICPDIYCRFGHGLPDEIAQKARAEGGVHDESVVGDSVGAMNFIRSMLNSNGKVGVIGTCSGGRHAFLAACTAEGFDAVVDCWGGGVVMTEEQLSPARPVSPLDYTEKLNCPILGIFGNDDHMPTPEEVNILEEKLKEHGKDYEFHRYDGAGHGFWYYHTEMYRPKQAMDSWEKVFEFFGRHLKD
jgi:carboxymethylenebutenolidase